ncbi:MAG: hypothetical protein JJT77_12285 [Crocinitomicaceae bacterium]|nr:hypothetical protein [Crocinitomicaceae bacterium]
MNRLFTALKVMVIVFVGCLPINTCLSQTFDSAADGNWVSPASWAGGVAPAPGPGGGLTNNGNFININAPHTITKTANLEIRGNSDLVVRSGGTLIVTGDLTFRNNSRVVVESGGFLIVEGNLTNNNNSDEITVDGVIQVAGNVTAGNGSAMNGNGTLLVEGSITLTGGGSNAGQINLFISALPVELLFFEGTFNKLKGVNELVWKTASEINNYYFTIYYSTDGFVWEPIAQIYGAGNSNKTLEYTWLHKNFVNGINYYQLSQTDFDGTTVVFPPIAIENSFNKQLLYRVNMMGQKVNSKYKGVVVEYYNDGSSLKRHQH